MLALIAGVMKVLELAPDCEKSKSPPVGESYQLKVPGAPTDAPSVAVGFPQVLPLATVTVGVDEIVAATAALAVVHVPLSNST